MHGASSLLLFVVPFTLAAIMPGPAQTALVARVIARGGRTAIPFVGGMVAGNALWLCMAALGLSAIALRFEFAFLAIKWLGIAYLCFVAWKLWTAPPVIGGEDDPLSRGWVKSVVGGLALTLGNPKAVLFFGAILPHTVDLRALTLPTFLLILGLGIAIDLAVQTAYVLLSGRLGRLIRSSRRLRLVNRSAAGIMAGSAAAIAARS
jgi:threonine/homoserine/homoserine lactone efflux protein